MINKRIMEIFNIILLINKYLIKDKNVKLKVIDQFNKQ